MGQSAYPDATTLYVTADAGGSNGYRSRNWKHELQKLADEIGLTIHVSHFPPGTSKWNKVEHRLFCHIHSELAWHAADDLRDHRRPHRKHTNRGRASGPSGTRRG